MASFCRAAAHLRAPVRFRRLGTVDLGAYPIRDPGSTGYQALVSQCKGLIASSGYCQLDGFVLPETVRAMCAEARQLRSRGLGFTSTNVHNLLLEAEEESSSAAPASPRAQVFHSSKTLVAMSHLPESSPLRELYADDALRELVRECFGLPRLSCSADPHGGVYYNFFDEGDALWWHCDRSHFSVNLILQTAEGGDFEFIPESRHLADEIGTWADLEKDLQRRKRVPKLNSGSIYLFAGNASFHRVSPVTSGTRINAILTYNVEENQRLNAYTLKQFFGIDQDTGGNA
ncbi:unnamed protein product [Symbiodinium natans]|uniref:Fe2OG dioxygenase domain-containing protein n=1 Tax=Symbiodinium natans TaxID=878477 RepID=A0A812QAU4_9DINO|nr:unnamed protein product [Symbiodinium natans]